MTGIKKLNLFYVLSILLLLSSKHSVCEIIDTPTTVSGMAKFTGTIKIPEGVNNENILVKITVPHIISGEFVKYSAVVDGSGNFLIDADVETSFSYIHFSTSLNPEKSLLIKLRRGAVTHLDVAYNSNFDIENIVVKPDMNQNDMSRFFGLMGQMIQYPIMNEEPLYNRSTDYFLSYSKSKLHEILGIVRKDTLISEDLKNLLSNDFRLLYYRVALLEYEKAMKANYIRTGGDQNKKVVIQKIDRSYYGFLRDLKLNDPQNLYALGSFLEFQKQLLQNKILAITKIGDTDISTWLADVKTNLSNLLGFDGGQYYDILAANSYGSQLTDELRPLNSKQQENIRNYWGNGEIAKILFRKNQQIQKLDKFKSQTVINDLSSVEANNVIDTIVTKHKGKVILIDLWATWCGPCLEAMQRFRSTKTEFYGKDVVFVYLTNGSSPIELWEEKIKAIGNEHYYLNNAQWKYIMDNFGFDAIPSYLLFNRKGILSNKFTAFPENEEVRAMINGLL